jgi:hypothetical protein
MFLIKTARENTKKYREIIEKIDTAIEKASLAGENYIRWNEELPLPTRELYSEAGYFVKNTPYDNETDHKITIIRW